MTRPATGAHPDVDALGVTWLANQGGGAAFVFYGRFERAATNNRLDVAMVLSGASTMPKNAFESITSV